MIATSGFPRTDGEHSRCAKLNWQIVDHIRLTYSRWPRDVPQHEFCDEMAAMFGVSRNSIRKVIVGDRWNRNGLATVE